MTARGRTTRLAGGSATPQRAGTIIVGRGKLGRALHFALSRAGAEVTLVAGRRVAPRDVSAARVVVLALPDAAITSCAERIAGGLTRGAVVLHCAGRLGVEPLAACAATGAAIGVMHPLVSFASTRVPPPLVGATFVIAGDARAVRAARALTTELGAVPLIAALHGAAYHAAAALLAGGAVALTAHAIDVLVALGLHRNAARRALAGLLASVAANLAHLDAREALTGPVARGDAATIAAHRVALHAVSPEAHAVYDAIAPAVLRVAVSAGLDAQKAAAVRDALNEASQRTTRRRPRAR